MNWQLSKKVKKMRLEEQKAAEADGTAGGEFHRGKLVTYFSILSLLCKDPEKE